MTRILFAFPMPILSQNTDATSRQRTTLIGIGSVRRTLRLAEEEIESDS